MFSDLTSFLSNSTIHGLAHIPPARRLSRLFWLSVVVAGLMGSSFLIVKSFRGWQESPISTSVEILPINQFTFPNVTVCPPRDSFTLLNYDLVMADRISLDDDVRAKLLTVLAETVLSAGYQDVLNDLNNFWEKNRAQNWYQGRSKINLPYWNAFSQQKYYKPETLASSGEIVSPFFGEAWTEEKFEAAGFWRLLIVRPWSQAGASLVVEVEQDMITEVGSSNFGSSTEGGDYDLSFVDGYLDRSKRNLTIVLAGKEKHSISLKRKITEGGLRKIKREKIPGFRVSWAWNESTATDQDFLAENRNFIRIANIVHQMAPDTEEVYQFFKGRRDVLLALSACENNRYKNNEVVEDKLEKIIEKFTKVQSTSSPLENITDSDLETASDIYLSLIYCPTWTDRRKQLIDLYTELFRDHNARSIMLSVAKIITFDVEEKDVFEYNLAQTLYNEVWSLFALESKAVSVLTTRKSDIEGNVMMKDFYLNHTHCFNGSLTQECKLVNKTVAALLNNPVHLVDEDGKLSPSAFIPFCEFGGDPHVMGKKMDEFEIPVCTSFTEKIYNGQLCYGVDVNQFKMKGTFRSKDLRLGLTLLLDYNSERALRRFEKNKLESVAEGSISKRLLDSKEREEALILLDTITPIELYGAGQYELNNVKEIVTTESFLGMEQKTIGCSSEEKTERCQTRLYLERLNATCHCLPFTLKYHLGLTQVPVCTPVQLDCVNTVKLEDAQCLPQCSGVFITNVEENSGKIDPASGIDYIKLMKKYEKYEYFKGTVDFSPEFKYEADLRFVRIYLNTPTFEKITKDQSSKIEDKISTIGGNLGLLLGFSIVSGVELIFFLATSILRVLRKYTVIEEKNQV